MGWGRMTDLGWGVFGVSLECLPRVKKFLTYVNLSDTVDVAGGRGWWGCGCDEVSAAGGGANVTRLVWLDVMRLPDADVRREEWDGDGIRGFGDVWGRAENVGSYHQ